MNTHFERFFDRNRSQGDDSDLLFPAACITGAEANKGKLASVDTPLPGLTDASLVVLFNGAGSGMARDFHLATKGIITLSAPTSFS